MHRLDHAAKLLATFNVLELDGGPLGDFGLVARRPVVSMAMWPVVVIVLCENLDQVVDMVAAKNNEVLGEAVTDASGMARFDAGLTRGRGGLTPLARTLAAGPPADGGRRLDAARGPSARVPSACRAKGMRPAFLPARASAPLSRAAAPEYGPVLFA